MMMPSNLRKLILSLHIASSLGWFGAAAGFLVLGIVGLTSQDAETIRGAYLSMDLITKYAIIPISLLALAIGLFQALFTEWGLFRHYWILTKFLLTILANVVLLVKTKLIGFMAGKAAEMALTYADYHQQRIELVVHCGGGMLVLLLIAVISVFKPWGRTGYGRQIQQRKQGAEAQSTNPSSAAKARDVFPLSLKIATAIGLAVAVLAITHHVVGGCGMHNH